MRLPRAFFFILCASLLLCASMRVWARLDRGDAGTVTSGGVALDPQDPRRLTMDAAMYLRRGDNASALAAAETAIRRAPQDLDARDVQALALIRLRRLDEALGAVNRALKLAPTRASFWTSRALINNLRGMYGAAANDAEQAASFDARDAQAHLNAAWAADGKGDRETALRELREAARFNPAHTELLARARDLPPKGLARLLSGEGTGEAEPPAPRGPQALLIGLTAFSAALVLVLGFFLLRGGRPKTAPAAGEQEEEGGAPGEGDSIAGSYQVVRQLGIGGMGIVYEAVDTVSGRRVAIKKMRDEIREDPHERERFLREARIVAALHHPNIVEIYEVAEDEGDAFLVFEFVDGVTLHELLRGRGRMTFPDTVRVIEGAAAALDYAHGRGMIHRDLKPSNFMMSTDGKVKLMDFGVARQVKESLERMAMTNTVVGTPSYMAPEQEQGRLCKESDVYSLGICLYEMLTGELPFPGAGPSAVMGAKMQKRFAPASKKVPGLPAGFDEFMERTLDPEPAARWRSAGQFAARLRELAGG